MTTRLSVSRPAMFRLRGLLLLPLLLLLLGSAVRGQTAWVQAHRQGDEVRFLFTSAVHRYNLVTRAWENTTSLPRSGATAMTGDGEATYIAYGTAIYRYQSGAISSETSFGTTSSAISFLYLDGNLLLAVHASGGKSLVSTFDRTAGTRLFTTANPIDSHSGSSHAPAVNTIFGKTVGSFPADLIRTTYNDAGTVTATYESPYHGQYDMGERSWVFPDQRQMVTSSGTVFTTDTLRYQGSFGGAVDDIAWNGDVPILLRGTNLIAFTSTLQETGRAALGISALEVAVTGTDAFAFARGTPRPLVQIVPLTVLNAPVPGSPVDAFGLAYQVNDAFLDRDGTVGLLSSSHMHLFRWSTAQRAYLPAVPLSGVPEHIAYSPVNHTVYTSYPDRDLRELPLSPAAPVEADFAVMPEITRGLVATGDFIYSIHLNGFRVWRPDGTGVPHNFTLYPTSATNTWDPVRRRIYHFYDGVSPNDLMYHGFSAEGPPIEVMSGPDHGTYSYYPPLRVKPDGNHILIGSGVIFAADDLGRIASLANAVTDALWSGSTLVTIRLNSGSTQLQTWNGSTYTAQAVTRTFSGTPVRLFSTPAGLLVITMVDGGPRFTLLDAAYNTVFASPLRPAAPGSLAVTGSTHDSVSLQWSDLSNNEDGFRVDYRRTASSDAWNAGPVVGAGIRQATVTGLGPRTAYEFRAVATNAGLLSAPSGTVTATTPPSPDEPAGEPYNLAVIRVYHDSITLRWTDNATNETGFRLLRSTSATGETTPVMVPANATTYTDTPLTPATTYYYRIQAVRDQLSAPLSAQVNSRTPIAPSVPGFPLQLSSSEIGLTSARLTWQDSSLNEDEFIIERSTLPITTWTEAGRVGFNVTTFVDTGLTPLRTYAFRVRAANSQGSSSSTIISLTTLRAGGTWLGHGMRQGGVYYFAFSGPARIERYDLAARTWLAPIPMQAPAAALWVDESAVFAAEGRTVVRWNHDGTGRAPLGTLPADITELCTTGDVLAVRNGGFTTLNKHTGAPLSSFAHFGTVAGLSYDPFRRRIFGSASASLRALDIEPAGTLAGAPEAGTPGGITARRTFVFPPGGRVADDAGNVFSAEGPQYIASLGAAFTDLAFHGPDVPVVLRGNKLHAYSGALQPAGSFTLPSADGLRVAVDGADALVFFPDGTQDHGISMLPVPLTEMNTPQAGQPVNPAGLPFSVTDAFVDRDGTVNLYAMSQMHLFRWSPDERRYTGSIPLTGAPHRLSYLASSHTLYTAYGASRTLRQMPLAGPAPTESLFAALSVMPAGLAAAEDFLFVATPAPKGYLTLAPDGSTLSSGTATGYSDLYDPVRRRVYFLAGDFLSQRWSYHSIGPDGRVTGTTSSTTLLEIDDMQSGQVSPDGQLLASLSGSLFSADSLLKIDRVRGGPFTDLAWQENRLAGITPFGSGTRVHLLQPGLESGRTVALDGTPVRVLTLDASRLLVITSHTTGEPRLHVLGADLSVQSDSIAAAPVILEQPDFTRVDFRSTAQLKVTAAGTPPLRYQWFKGPDPLPGAAGPVLEIPEIGSGDSGSYTVAVTNDSGTVTSVPALVAAGPVPAPRFATGNLLVSSNREIHEYTPAGVLVKSLPIQPAPGVTRPDYQFSFDVEADALGSIYVLNRGIVNGWHEYFLSTYDPVFDAWKHTALPLLARSYGSPSPRSEDLALAGDWMFHYRGRINVRTGESVLLPADFRDVETAVSPAGAVYGYSLSGEVRRLFTDTWTWSAPVMLSGPGEVFALAPDASQFLSGRLNGAITSHGIGGDLIQTFQPPASQGSVQHLSLSPDGKLAAGFYGGSVTILTAALTAPVTITPPGISTTGAFTEWAPPVPQPAPSFPDATSPAALEDTAWTWTPALRHSDPHAVLTLSPVRLPSWMSFSAGQLSGTPLHEHSGLHQVVLRLSDNSGRSVEQSFSVEAVEVNDKPVAQDLTLQRTEDDPPEDIALAPLFSDEETADDGMIFTVAATSGEIVTATITGQTLRLVFLPDASGTGTVTVRGMDAGGLFAESVLSVFAAPVNDPPVIPAAIPDISAGDSAADAVVDFSPFVTDPDAGDVLTWRVISNSNPAIFRTLDFDAQGRLTLAYTPYISGAAEVTVEVSDRDGTFARRTFGIVLPDLPLPALTLQSALTLNRQTGLWEQRVLVRNTAARSIGGFEIRVAGLPADTCLYNAADCLGSDPATGYYQPVPPGESVSLILEYYSPGRSTFAPRLSVTPVLPRDATSKTPGLAIDRVLLLEPGALLLEFPAVPDELYLIQYSSDGARWIDSLVRIRAGGTRVQWIDRGAPRTVSPPGMEGARFYRVRHLAP